MVRPKEFESLTAGTANPYWVVVKVPIIGSYSNSLQLLIHT